ncbi:hypothetical protein K490DRAFT_59054 [Saccharata proteae CBS 121410]|uniref:Uncharacterized protein n=1 Tax=Saccharata proteae CBS 121410 TaxID=1314787 RepID=A0A9P4HTM1_9PEZI|nr:hypothetical protein K490DRAFT_59054 [Saccharata proteae CBS 121410]
MDDFTMEQQRRGMPNGQYLVLNEPADLNASANRAESEMASLKEKHESALDELSKSRTENKLAEEALAHNRETGIEMKRICDKLYDALERKEGALQESREATRQAQEQLAALAKERHSVLDELSRVQEAYNARLTCNQQMRIRAKELCQGLQRQLHADSKRSERTQIERTRIERKDGDSMDHDEPPQSKNMRSKTPIAAFRSAMEVVKKLEAERAEACKLLAELELMLDNRGEELADELAKAGLKPSE